MKGHSPMLYALRIFALLGATLLFSLSAYAIDPSEEEAIEEYCKSIADQSQGSTTDKAQTLDGCVQEQRAMVQDPEIVPDIPATEVSPQLLEQCYQLVDRYLKDQLAQGNDNPPDYDSLLDKCVANQGVLPK